jgi:hypothetical protein
MAMRATNYVFYRSLLARVYNRGEERERVSYVDIQNAE